MYLQEFLRAPDQDRVSKASDCWNLEECEFKLAEMVNRVYGKKSANVVQTLVNGTDREQITVLSCDNAASNVFALLYYVKGRFRFYHILLKLLKYPSSQLITRDY